MPWAWPARGAAVSASPAARRAKIIGSDQPVGKLALLTLVFRISISLKSGGIAVCGRIVKRAAPKKVAPAGLVLRLSRSHGESRPAREKFTGAAQPPAPFPRHIKCDRRRSLERKPDFRHSGCRGRRAAAL